MYEPPGVLPQESHGTKTRKGGYDNVDHSTITGSLLPTGERRHDSGIRDHAGLSGRRVALATPGISDAVTSVFDEAVAAMSSGGGS